MIKYKGFESFPSILNLSPDNDPYEEAIKLLKRSALESTVEIRALKAQLDEMQRKMEEMQTLTLEHYRGGLSGDMERIGIDFKKAALKLYNDEGLSQRAISDSIGDKLLLNDNDLRYAK